MAIKYRKKVLKFLDYWFNYIVAFLTYSYRYLKDNPVHLVFKMEGRLPVIVKESHHDFVEKKQSEINTIPRRQDLKRYLLKCFRKARGCNFVGFDTGSRGKYIQFKLQRGGIILSFFPSVHKDTKKMHYLILGVLTRLSFTANSSSWSLGHLAFEEIDHYLKDDKEINEIVARFKNNEDLAAKFCAIVISDIFNKTIDNVKCYIG